MKTLEKYLGVIVYVAAGLTLLHILFTYAVFGYNNTLMDIGQWLYPITMVLLILVFVVKMFNCKTGSLEWAAWLIAAVGMIIVEVNWILLLAAEICLIKGIVAIVGNILTIAAIVIIGYIKREETKLPLITAIANTVIYAFSEIYFMLILPRIGVYSNWPHYIIPIILTVLNNGLFLLSLIGIINPQLIVATDSGSKLPTNRGWFKYVALTLITFGIYGIFVLSHMSREINRVASDHDGRHTMHYCLILFLLGPITFQIATLVWFTKICNRMGNELKVRNIDYKFGGSDYWLWNILGSLILVGPFVFLARFFKAMNLINRDYNEK